MTEEKRPTLSIKRKPKLFVNPKHGNKPSTAGTSAKEKPSKPAKKAEPTKPPKPPKPLKAKVEKPVKEVTPKKAPPKPLSKAERAKRNRAKMLRKGQVSIVKLVALWPDIFDLDNPKPLKIGIAPVIRREAREKSLGVTSAQIGYALRYHTQSQAYLLAILKNSNRFDLDGQVCGEITEKEKDHTKNKLKNLYGIKEPDTPS